VFESVTCRYWRQGQSAAQVAHDSLAWQMPSPHTGAEQALWLA
jgi:hypothetical protein